MPTNVLHCESPASALECLCDGFIADAPKTLRFTHVKPADMPDPCRKLLVHDGHMTTALETYYRQSVELRVIRERLEGDDYRREIVLTLNGGDHVVEYGIVRMDLTYTSQAVRDEIVARDRPLGDILMRHDVLRHIEPQWYLRFSADSPLLQARFDGSLAQSLFGRIGVIYCNGHPAIELLEVVSGGRKGRRDEGTEGRSNVDVW